MRLLYSWQTGYLSEYYLLTASTCLFQSYLQVTGIEAGTFFVQKCPFSNQPFPNKLKRNIPTFFNPTKSHRVYFKFYNSYFASRVCNNALFLAFLQLKLLTSLQSRYFQMKPDVPNLHHIFDTTNYHMFS